MRGWVEICTIASATRSFDSRSFGKDGTCGGEEEEMVRRGGDRENGFCGKEERVEGHGLF